MTRYFLDRPCHITKFWDTHAKIIAGFFNFPNFTFLHCSGFLKQTCITPTSNKNNKDVPRGQGYKIAFSNVNNYTQLFCEELSVTVVF